MKKHILTALAALAVLGGSISGASAQTASFTFNDFVGTPNGGSYGPGQTFSFSVFLNFTPGGSVANLEGLSYWMQQNSGGPFPFTIIGRDFTGSLFTDAQTPGITFPQALTPSNASDLGAILATPTGLGAGTYFIARITIAISATAANGNYSIGSTFAGAKTSVVSDDQGHTFSIQTASYNIALAPDGGSTAVLLGLGVLGLAGLARYRKQLA